MSAFHFVLSRLFDIPTKIPFELISWRGERVSFGEGAPRASIRFRTRAAFATSLLRTSLGLGEAYVRGDVEVEGDLEDALTALATTYLAIGEGSVLGTIARRGAVRSLQREKDDVEHHYGRGEGFYELYLDRKLQYSCAYFQSPEDTLDEAQERKIAHTARKLDLRPGQRLLDIGCGWGHLMFHAAETYGVSCLGLTLCENQARYIREVAKARRLPVEVRVMNYLELDRGTTFERVVSVGMMCHIGEARIDAFYDTVERLLAPGAIGLLHCIAKMRESPGVDPFVEKYVFPGYWFNSLEGMTSRAVSRGLHVLDVENLRRHYARTASHWRRNFLANRARIREKTGFDEAFLRTWDFYLASVVAGFRSGHLHLLQMVLSKGLQDDYPMTRDFLYAKG